jgi:hypothetical protein
MADIFKAIHTYSDPAFDQQNIYEYELSIRLNADGFSYCILDTNTGKFLQLQSFDFSDPSRKIFIPGEKENADAGNLGRLMEADLKWLGGPFQKVRIIYNGAKASLIPEALFNEEEKASIYDFNVANGPYPAAELKHDLLKSLNAYSIYHLPGPIGDLIKKYFPDAGLYHHSTAIIQSVFLNYMNKDTANILFVNTGSSRLDILQINGRRLEYYNSFNYNTAEDYMYYLIFVVEQLKLNPENVEVVMLGEVEKHSSLSDLMHKYIRNISFAPRNADFKYSFVFDQLPGHYYYNLLNASLCE